MILDIIITLHIFDDKSSLMKLVSHETDILHFLS